MSDEPYAARRLANALADSLERARTGGNDATTFIEEAVAALRQAPLGRNPCAAKSNAPCSGWDGLTAFASTQHDTELVNALVDVTEDLPWIAGNHFWADEKYAYFADHMWGAIVMGEEGAAYLTDERYIVLLHIQEPNAIYPLHEHRIPEGYYIVAGTNEWSHDGVNWETHAPGTLFFNESWQRHAIRTGQEPSLSLDIYLPPFGWEGGLSEID